MEVKLNQPAHGLAFDPTGNRLAVVGEEGIVEVWEHRGPEADPHLEA